MPSTVSDTIVVAIATLLLAQTAAATWYMGSSHEPDNGLDDPLFMRAGPPGDAKDLVYFNVITGSSGPVGGTFVNPNVGMLETRIEDPTLETHIAILGVWIDCNDDGYVGTALGAAREYSAELLADDTRCPGATGPVNSWTQGAHNYNGWVSELVPIGDSSPLDRRTYVDATAMIWGDYGRPDDSAAGGGSCAIAPQPRGTYQSTGGFLNYADCNAGVMDYWNIPWHGTRLVAQDIPGLNDFGLDLGVDFDDDDNATGTWADRPTFGTEDTAHSPVYVYDCEAEPIVVANGVSSNAIDPRMGEGDATTWTIPALVNHTIEGAAQDCDTSNDAGHDFYGAKIYVGETDFNAVSGANKREANFNFGFGVRTRGQVAGPIVPVAPGGTGGFNLGPNYSDWFPGIVTLTGPATLRVDIVEGTWGFPGAGYNTFYAHVGAATTGRGFRTPGGAEVYGSTQCGDNETGIHNGWNCDPATWYRNPDGTPVPEPARPYARPGQAYELRDVDCYDGAIGDSGFAAGTPYFGAEACP